MAITLDGTTGVTAAEFDGTVEMSNLTGTMNASNLTGNINASQLTGALPAIDGSALTGIDTGAGSVQVWLNLNGRSFGIVADGNVSSATDQGTGRYLINYSSAVGSSSYQVAGTAYGGATAGIYGLTINSAYTPLARTTSSLEFDTERTSNFAREDTADINIAVIL